MYIYLSFHALSLKIPGHISTIKYFSGPVGYDPELPSVPTLTLSNLIAGKGLQLKTTF